MSKGFENKWIILSWTLWKWSVRARVRKGQVADHVYMLLMNELQVVCFYWALIDDIIPGPLYKLNYSICPTIFTTICHELKEGERVQMSTTHSWRKIISTTQDSGYHPSPTGQHLSSVPGKQFLLMVHIIRKNMKIRKKAKKTNPGAICSSSLENIQKLNFNIGKKSWCVYKNNALIRSNLP